MKKIIVLFIVDFILIMCLLLEIYCHYNKIPAVTLKKDLSAKINTEVYPKQYIKKIVNGKIISKNTMIDTSKLGEKQVKIQLQNLLNKKYEYIFSILIIDTEKPEINNTKDITITEGDKIDLLKDIEITDNSKEEIKAKIEGTYDLNKAGTYNLKYIAEDSSNNISEKSFILTVKAKPKPVIPIATYNPKNYVQGYPYYIRVNKTNNIVIVYGNNNGKYSKVEKVFLSSPGVNTPVGTFRTKAKYVWHILEGPVWGQYSTRITGHYLFHSVPYLKRTKDSLEYWEYNLLGNKRSMGCIRLTVIDAKWIYDNCPLGTTVEIYNGALNGIQKPSVPRINTANPNRGWDPTDPDPANPWHK